jgi:ribokinase
VSCVAVIGYASLDHVAMLDGVPRPGRTTTILDRPESAWPRLGGSPAYVAAALVEGGIAEAYPVSWIGGDDAGHAYRAQLRDKHVPADGIIVVEGARTPVAILAYEPEGGCLCLYHPGMPKGLRLADQQRRLISRADWLCVTVGPPDATRDAFDTIGDATKLAWVVKDDPRALPRELAMQLAARADLICFSRDESAFVGVVLAALDAFRPGQLLIETRGGSGASVTRDGDTHVVTTEPMDIADPTGAGDTFAGGVLAALAKGETDPVSIVEAGHRAARGLLVNRRATRTESA